MFTGLVETIGIVADLQDLDSSESGGNGTSLTITSCSSVLPNPGTALGDSISVNGTCLTVTSLSNTSSDHDSWSFKVGVSPETLRRTNLGRLAKNSRVNLERAVSADTRMGGHFVQGHVDTVATIASVTPDGNAFTYRLAPRTEPTGASVLRYIVEKGYVTLDGASLTITAVDDHQGWFEVMLIPYTQERVVMGGKNKGDEVNVEIDVVGKYVEKSVVGYFEKGNLTGAPSILEKMVGSLVEEKIKAMGMGMS